MHTVGSLLFRQKYIIRTHTESIRGATMVDAEGRGNISEFYSSRMAENSLFLCFEEFLLLLKRSSKKITYYIQQPMV